jgi:hypothetical protein
MSRLDRELALLGGLDPVAIRNRWLSVEKAPAPTVPDALLRRLLAQRMQERRFGAMPAMVVRELGRVLDKGAIVPGQAPRSALTPGTRLIREWNGRTIAVEVREDGFLWEGRTYRSLSVIAREVTGAHWSGPRFFGIQRRG